MAVKINAGSLGILMLMALPFPAQAEGAIDVSGAFTFDTVAVWSEDRVGKVYYLDNLDLLADARLDDLIGWDGATAHVHVLNNLGAIPNDRAGTLQGVDNIEVGSQRLRLFEAWIEQKIGKSGSVRFGLYDLNSEFYANEAAGLLIAPAFGVGSEIAATGPNGPSIFPSTALAVRVDQGIGETGYIRGAILNAQAGTLGDPDGVNLSFNDGALAIAELGIENEEGKLAFGSWGYTDRQDDIYAVDVSGEPVQRKARGAYLVAERVLRAADDAPGITAFIRAGLSDGKTSPFRGGWQAGLLIAEPFAGRPDSQFSIGANQAYLSRGYKRLLEDDGVDAAGAETAFEVTYSDTLNDWITVQPDLQMILDPGGDSDASRVIVGAFRVSLAF